MAERAAHILAAACEEAVEEREVFRIALSGGHTPEPLFRLLGPQGLGGTPALGKISIFWVDERCVGPDDPESNYGLARRELLSRVPATHFFRMRGDEDPGTGSGKLRKTAARGIQAGFQRNSTLRPDAAGHGRGWPHCFNFPQFPAAA